MFKISRLLLIASLLSSGLLASNIDNDVLEFEKKRFSSNKRIKIISLDIALKEKMPIKGWYGFVVNLKADVQGKEINAKDMIFSNGEVIAPELIDIKTGLSLKELLSPKLTSKYYNKKNLIAGTHNAKDKIVIFSDPLCPFCISYIPDVIRHVKKNKDIALYYYHFPLLQIHPAASIISKAMIVAHEKNIKDVELKIYKADFEKDFDVKETNQEKILKAINKVLKSNITINEINKTSIDIEVKNDIKLGSEVMVEGTPTIFINGVKDNSKLKYETLGK
ncbi:MAG: DsbA family protein [Campylobacteraceae bacterium]|nr:DsbA family protein [Campylobacteraceae bacterium]